MSDSSPSIAEEVKKDNEQNRGAKTDDVPGVRGPQANDKGKETDGATSPTNWNRFAQSSTEPNPKDPKDA